MDVSYARRLVLAVEPHEFGSRPLKLRKEVLRRGLRTAFQDAVEQAGLVAPEWQTSPDGGGTAVFAADVPEAKILDSFTHQLHGALIQHNRLHSADGALRVRLAVHHGMVSGSAEDGFDGPAATQAGDLARCDEAAHALDATTAVLVVIVSDPVMTDTVGGSLSWLEERDMRRVEVRGRPAWLWLLGAEPPAESRPDPPTPPSSPPPPAAPAQSITGHFAYADIHAHQVVAGDVINQRGTQ
ncbi:hypothetical protein FDA94_26615 [Herbidospora galbida]|uniref:Guanylate cyclase domain-containing protein n=1 Tax=Herbidospora galbida TaxID=2575442 RepID=A0A4U3M8E8_9ACTN|nr:hypothetical protein [Herbidospora galbida]TKK85245.1 hypothetical protein FDA94_26615 [Herbidospora galbida]